jgi:hypothetical protein
VTSGQQPGYNGGVAVRVPPPPAASDETAVIERPAFDDEPAPVGAQDLDDTGAQLMAASSASARAHCFDDDERTDPGVSPANASDADGGGRRTAASTHRVSRDALGAVPDDSTLGLAVPEARVVHAMFSGFDPDTTDAGAPTAIMDVPSQWLAQREAEAALPGADEAPVAFRRWTAGPVGTGAAPSGADAARLPPGSPPGNGGERATAAPPAARSPGGPAIRTASPPTSLAPASAALVEDALRATTAALTVLEQGGPAAGAQARAQLHRVVSLLRRLSGSPRE